MLSVYNAKRQLNTYTHHTWSLLKLDCVDAFTDDAGARAGDTNLVLLVLTRYCLLLSISI